MRSTATLATIALLLAGSAYARNAAAQSAAEPPPLCGEDPAATTVRIDVDSDAKSVDPDECVVAPGTTVVWWEDGATTFETSFSTSPDSRGGRRFKSSKVGNHHEAKFKAKNVTSRQAFNYVITIDGQAMDPSVIIDPASR